MVKLLKITRRGFLSAYCSLRTKWSETKRNVACVASVSVQLRSKERGTRVKDRAKNGVSERAGRGWERKEGKAFQRPPEVDFLHSWAVILGQIFRQIVSIRVMTLINTNVVASRHIKREEVLLPVAVRRSKTRGNENVTHSSQSEFSRRNGFFGGNFLFRISE